MKKLVLVAITLIISVAMVRVWAEGNIAAGKIKAGQCAACHGVDGNSVNPEWPKLAGQHADYLVKQLAYFEAGERENITMKPMASILDAQGREDVAAYYASQTASIGEADPELVEFGEQIYRSGNAESSVAPCMGCHGPSGAGNPAAGYPALRGQHAKYIENQLHGFAEGKRVNESATRMMQILAVRMTNREIRSVAAYIQGLH